MSLQRLLQQMAITPLYFKYSLFPIDLLYLIHYWNKNPYRLCKNYFSKMENREVHYGDTWPLAIYRLTQVLALNSQDVLFEVGSGTGRASLWFHALSDCEVYAIEKVPTLIQIAEKIKQKLGFQKVHFIESDLLNADYSKATVIYFYSSNFSESILEKLIEKWKSLKPKTRIVTTSFSLCEMAEDYQLIVSYRVSYPWGLCNVYIQEKL